MDANIESYGIIVIRVMYGKVVGGKLMYSIYKMRVADIKRYHALVLYLYCIVLYFRSW